MYDTTKLRTDGYIQSIKKVGCDLCRWIHSWAECHIVPTDRNTGSLRLQ